MKNNNFINNLDNWDRFSKIGNVKNRNYHFTHVICSFCNSNKVKKILNKHLGICSLCKKRTLFVNLQKWQEEFIKVKTSIKISAGAVGTGKTFLSCIMLYLHFIEIPLAVGNIYASTLQQLDNVFKKEFIKFFLKEDFFRKSKEQWILKNGTIINWKSSSKAFDTKGSNLTFAVMTEANLYKDDSLYNEIRKRLRASQGFVFELDRYGNYKMIKDKNGQLQRKIIYDKTLLILESNNEMSYVTDLIERGNIINYTADVDIWSYNFKKPYGGKEIGVCLSALKDDVVQSKTYKDDIIAKTPEHLKSMVLRAGKARHNNYLYSYFERNIIDNDKSINGFSNLDGKRVQNKVFYVSDLGGIKKNNAKTTLLVCVIDLKNEILYIVDEHYKTGSPIEHAISMKALIKLWNNGFEFCGHGCDSSADRVNAGYEISPIDNYSKYGVDMIPIRKPHRKADMVGDVNLLFKLNKLRIMKNCTNLINELYNSYYHYNIKNKKMEIKLKNDDLTDTLNYVVQWVGIDSKVWIDFDKTESSHANVYILKNGKFQQI